MFKRHLPEATLVYGWLLPSVLTASLFVAPDGNLKETSVVTASFTI